MIFVTDAGYQGMVALSACSTLPVSASTTSSASACTARGVTRASAAIRKIQFNEWRCSRRRRCTFRSGPLRPALKKGGPLDLTFGFQACPAPSLCGKARIYTGLAGQNRARAIKSWTKSSQIRRCLNRDRAHAGLFGLDRGARILVHHELGLREFREASALGDQFIERSAFDHAAIVEHQDTGGVANGRKPMRDHEGGAALHHLVEGGIDLGFGDGVERAGRLVEDQD